MLAFLYHHNNIRGDQDVIDALWAAQIHAGLGHAMAGGDDVNPSRLCYSFERLLVGCP